MIVDQEVLTLFGSENKVDFAEQMQSRNENKIIESLGIEFMELTLDYVVVTMPVGPKTRQSVGILHGGASVALA